MTTTTKTKDFYVEVPVTHIRTFLVEAESSADALRQVEQAFEAGTEKELETDLTPMQEEKGRWSIFQAGDRTTAVDGNLAKVKA